MLLSSATVPDLDRLTARVIDTPDRGSGCRMKAYRIDDGFFVDVVLPGTGPADIDITVDSGVLTVRAERADRDGEPSERQFDLAETLDTDRLEARFADGVLTLTIPVTGKAKPREFEVAGV
jgi:HSP20 family protein